MTPFTHTLGVYLEVWPILLLWPILFWREGLYKGLWITGGEHLRQIIQATALASLLVMASTFVSKTGPQYSRAVVLGGWFISVPMFALTRSFAKGILTWLGFTGPRAIILGGGLTCSLILDRIEEQRPPSLRPVAIFDNDPEKIGKVVRGVRVVGSLREASEWAKQRGVSVAVIAIRGVPKDRLIPMIEKEGSTFRRLLVVPDLFGLSTAETIARDVGGVLALEVKKNLVYPYNKIVKRLMDIMLSLLFSIIAIPVVLLISLLSFIETGQPILFGQTRVGILGTLFKAWKFRTMVPNADQALARFLERNPDAKREWEEKQKLTDDPRLTRVGKLLRRFSLDELPQLWNVLTGEMSLVGPRPMMEDQIPLYGPGFDLYVQVQPGLTGLWQVSGRASLSFQERAELDTYYVRNWSIWLDFVILIRTVWVVLSGQGAY